MPHANIIRGAQGKRKEVSVCRKVPRGVLGSEEASGWGQNKTFSEVGPQLF